MEMSINDPSPKLDGRADDRGDKTQQRDQFNGQTRQNATKLDLAYLAR